MTIKELQYMIDELNIIKTNGGSDYKKASTILNSEPTTENITKAMKLISTYYNNKKL